MATRVEDRARKRNEFVEELTAALNHRNGWEDGSEDAEMAKEEAEFFADWVETRDTVFDE